MVVQAKTVQFVNDMILGSQTDLPEIEELSKRLFREKVERVFWRQALRVITSVSDLFYILGLLYMRSTLLTFCRLKWTCGSV